MSLVKYSSDLSPFFGNLDDLFSVFDSLDPMTRPVRSVTGPKTSVENKEDRHLIQLATPGVAKDNLVIDINEGRLSISFDQQSTDTKPLFQRSFKKSWTLPKDVDVDNISAEYTDGVLKIDIPKSAPSKPSQKRIEIG